MTAGSQTAPLLEVRDLQAYYGHIHALKGVSFKVEKGEIVTLIGGNGAGKTTTLATISRLLTSSTGDILFEGRSITGLEPHDVVNAGIAHVPEGRRIFSGLTILENLEMGAFALSDKAEIARRLEHGFTLFPRLKERVKQLGGTLSGGEQQMLAVARALMQNPRILLLDEPSMGLSPLFVERIFEIIEAINREGTTVLLVEQNAHMALGIAHRAYVLKNGEIAMEGDARHLLSDDAIREAYLGEG
ncbi:ABC transporter ATP-binding protein [Chthonobacter albigriseus]|uniref:ABC transporter ATP-binding protein n=1 Tax=Chthonobacter albigriseus TaxID=1683161 RepID=UPI0015EE3BDA|nr:ABC transporter ATP-binding protein [Chthonobacter albigriseus]